MTADIIRIEAILIGALDVVQSVFAAAHIERVAVGQERLSAQIFYHVHHSAGVVGAEIGQVARLSEMNLDGDVFVFQIHRGKTCFSEQAFQLHLQGVACSDAQVRAVYF